jgi:hypothetical protein
MLRNWQTTLFGFGAGALNLLANGMKWQQILLSMGLAVLGSVAKDHNVTGGNVSQ